MKYSKHQKEREEANRQFNEITGAELDTLRKAMESRKQERQNGRLQSRFRQVMFDWDVLKLLEDGSVSVKKPLEYSKWTKAESMIDASDARAQESFFQANPEQRVEWEQQLSKWFSETRETLKGIRAQMKV